LIALVGVPVLPLLAALLPVPLALKLTVAVLALLWQGFAVALMLRMKRVERGIGDAFSRGDADEVARLRSLIEGRREPRSPLDRARRLVGHAEELLLRERFAEAVELLERVDRMALPEVSRPGVLSELGYAMAFTGQPAKGVELARAAVAEAQSQRDYPASKRWHLDKRLGVTLELANRHDEAISVLHSVIERGGGSAYESAPAAFYIAKAFRGIGALEAAGEMMALAAKLEGPCAVRARAAIAAASEPLLPRRTPIARA
jgi:hypothetical protein